MDDEWFEKMRAEKLKETDDWLEAFYIKHKVHEIPGHMKAIRDILDRMDKKDKERGVSI